MTSNKSRQYSNLLTMMSLINISASLLSIYIFIKSIYLELIKSLIRVIHNSLVTHGVGEGVLAAIRARWEAKLYGAAPSQGATTTCPTRTSPSRMTSTAPSLATSTVPTRPATRPPSRRSTAVPPPICTLLPAVPGTDVDGASRPLATQDLLGRFPGKRKRDDDDV